MGGLMKRVKILVFSQFSSLHSTGNIGYEIKTYIALAT